MATSKTKTKKSIPYRTYARWGTLQALAALVAIVAFVVSSNAQLDSLLAIVIPVLVVGLIVPVLLCVRALKRRKAY